MPFFLLSYYSTFSCCHLFLLLVRYYYLVQLLQSFLASGDIAKEDYY